VIAFRVVDIVPRYVVTDDGGAPPQTLSARPGVTASQIEGTDLSGDGKWVAITTPDARMIPGDTNGVSDVFTRSIRSSASPT
jgi:hypothetical protein